MPRHLPAPGRMILRHGRRGFSLIEVMVALGLSCVLFAVITRQLVEGSKLSGRITHTLEHSHNARELIEALTRDIRGAQVLQLHPSFTDRASVARDGQLGNYLVLHQLSRSGVITRTVGYYLGPAANRRGWVLYRHDSAAGDSAPGTLPAADTAGRHRFVKRAERLPDGGQLFRCMRDRGITVHGEFGAPEASSTHRTELIRCTLSTRS